MRPEGALLFLTFSALSLAQPIVETDIDHGNVVAGETESEAASGDQFIVVLFPPQTRAYRHFYLADRKKHPSAPPPRFSTQDLAWESDMGFYGDQRAPLIGPEFDISADLYALINDFDSGNEWGIYDIVEQPFFDQGVSSDMRRIQATDLLKDSQAKGAIYLEFMALVSPEFDRLRVIARVAVFETRRRGGVREILENRYEYFSPARDPVLDESTNPDVAFARAWPPELMVAAVRLGIDKLRPMILSDMHEFDEHRPKGQRLVKFDVYNTYWAPGWRMGAVVERNTGRTVYRDKYGNVYSMPDE